MNDNIFMISDASYSDKTKCAGLGVIDLYTGKKYSHSVSNIKNSHAAEYRALLLSVRIAIDNGYDNVVFVYDNKGLNLDTLKLWLDGKIHSFQFLWLKRVFVNDADKLARKARSLQEKLIIKETLRETIEDSDLVRVFKRYTQHKIIRAFMSIANNDEYEILKTYRNTQGYPPVLVQTKSLDFFSDIYNLLASAKNKKRFYKFIDKNYSGTINVTEFQTSKSNEYYISVIKNIIDKLSYIDITFQKRISPISPSSQKQDDTKKFVKKLQKQSLKKIRTFCIRMAKGEDKKLLDAYFFAKKPKNYPMNKASVDLFLVVHHLLPDTQKNIFFNFIMNKIKKNKSLKSLFFVRNEEFYLDYLSRI